MPSDSQPPRPSPAPTPISLLLLPGMDGTGALFAPFIGALGQGRSVTAVAYPTSGNAQCYADLQAVAAAALPIDGQVVLLGESFSGPIAIALAAAHPDRVAGVVLCCTFVRNPRPALRWLRGLASVPAPLPPFPVISGLLLGRFATPALRLLLRHALAEVRPAVLRARLRSVISVDVRWQMRALDVPVLYLKARRDRLVPTEATMEAAQGCRDIRIQLFEAPHCLLQAVPAAAAEAVNTFIDAIAAASLFVQAGRPSQNQCREDDDPER